MIRSTSCVIDPALFTVPSMLRTWIGQSSFHIWNPCWVTNCRLMNMPVAPESNNAVPFIFLCKSRVSNPASSIISFFIFKVLTKNLLVSSCTAVGCFRIVIFLFWQGNEAVLNHAPALPQVSLLEAIPNGVQGASSTPLSLSNESNAAYLFWESSRGVTGSHCLLTPRSLLPVPQFVSQLPDSWRSPLFVQTSFRGCWC